MNKGSLKGQRGPEPPHVGEEALLAPAAAHLHRSPPRRLGALTSDPLVLLTQAGHTALSGHFSDRETEPLGGGGLPRSHGQEAVTTFPKS